MLRPIMTAKEIAFLEDCDTDSEDQEYALAREELCTNCDNIGLTRRSQKRERIPSEEKIPLQVSKKIHGDSNTIENQDNNNNCTLFTPSRLRDASVTRLLDSNSDSTEISKDTFSGNRQTNTLSCSNNLEQSCTKNIIDQKDGKPIDDDSKRVSSLQQNKIDKTIVENTRHRKIETIKELLGDGHLSPEEEFAGIELGFHCSADTEINDERSSKAEDDSDDKLDLQEREASNEKGDVSSGTPKSTRKKIESKENENKISSSVTTSSSKTSTNVMDIVARDFENVANIREQVIFFATTDLIFDRKMSSNVYRVRSRDDPDGPTLCFKFSTKHPRYHSRTPLELRLLSHMKASKDRNAHVQIMHSYLVAPNSYAFVSPFVRALTDIPEVLEWMARPDRIQKVMKQLLIGLRNIHRAGIIHRDIKPSNLLWDETTEYLVISDFGWSTWNTKKGHHVAVGTEGFMAPEVLRFDRDATKPPENYKEKCDIYSAGVLFGALLFGMKEKEVHEFHASLFRELVVEYFPGPTASLLLKMLRRDPHRRISARQALNASYFKENFGLPQSSSVSN